MTDEAHVAGLPDGGAWISGTFNKRDEREIIAPAVRFAKYTEDDRPPILLVGAAANHVDSVLMSYADPIGPAPRASLTVTLNDGSEITLTVAQLAGQELPGWYIAIRDEFLDGGGWR